MLSIKELKTVDSDGNCHSFIVKASEFELGKYKGIFYSITSEERTLKYFEFRILEISEKRILVYVVNNHDHEELTGKGIVKAMIHKLSETTGKDIVSSTNKENLKIDVTEGRINDVSKYWKKWEKEMPNVVFIENEDRYIYKPV